jgi:hypothetical protein
LVGDKKPNAYVIGISVSVHKDADNWKYWDSSTPWPGEIRATPGSGGELVATYKEAMELWPVVDTMHVSENRYVTPAASVEPGKPRIKLSVEFVCTVTVSDTGVSEYCDNEMPESLTDQAQVEVNVRPTVADTVSLSDGFNFADVTDDCSVMIG